jgi:hypothetical protein
MTRRVITIAVLLAAVTACSSNKRLESVPAESAATITVAETTVVETTTTVAETTTTEAPTTTAAPETTPPTTAAPDYTLRGTGVGTLVFTDPVATVVEALTAGFGAPELDEITEFPTPQDAVFVNDAEEVFDFPVGRTVCFTNTLCTVYGGPSAEALSFVGWYYAAEEAPTLSTAQGITLQSRWADFRDAMEVGEGGCYSDGYGNSLDGVSLYLRSLGTPFSGVDEAGNYLVMSPDPADVIVVQMQAGTLIGTLYGDC